MMKVAIVTDTNGGFSSQEAKELGIYLIPMPVLIDGKVLYEGVDLEESELYEALESNLDVTTSQPSPADIIDLWTELLDNGYDEIVHIPMSSGLSGSCQSAKGYALDFDGKVHVVDNHRLSVTMKVATLEAKRLADEGKTAQEIQDYLEETSYESTIYVAVNNIEYLKRGGRISPAVSKIGTMLNIKPLLSINGEALDAYAMVRGNMKKCQQKMIEAIKRDLGSRFSHFVKESTYICGAGAGLTTEEREGWIAMLKEAFPGFKVLYSPLSVSLGTHTGPGAIGIGIAWSKCGL